MATVAGIAPCSDILLYMDRAHYLFWGYGIPCEMIVDYRATTGLHLDTASNTFSDIFNIDGQILFIKKIDIIINKYYNIARLINKNTLKL